MRRGTRLAAAWAGAVLLALSSSAPVQAQTRQLLNYPAIHKPVVGDKGMVVSQSQVASEIGAQVLRDGGNAVDAAVATAFALAVVLPRAGNIGGDGFMLVHLAQERRTLAIDYRSAAPAGARLDMFVGPDGRVKPEASGGPLSAGVPGTVAGLALAHRKYGRLPWARLVQPAKALAEDGVVLTRDEAFALNWGRERLSRSEAGKRAYLKADGTDHVAGEVLRQRDLAWSLDQISAGGEDAFYRGAIARKLVADARANGGLLSPADLADYRAIERPALVGGYRGIEVATMPPASGGGTALVEALNILETFDMAGLGGGSAESLHLIAETLKLTGADRTRYLGDPAFVANPVAGLTSKAYAAERAKLIDPDRARPAAQAPAGDPWRFESPETTQISVVDAEGNAVSNTFTLGADFGSGIVPEGTGFLLGNLMGNFSLQLQAQGQAGTGGAPLTMNGIGPGRRPVSSMTPTMLLKDGRLWVVTGSPGGATIVGTVLQLVLGLTDFGLDVAEATHAPRIHQDIATGDLQIERGFSPDTLRLLKAKGHTLREGETIGSSQSVEMTGEGAAGAADPRRPGASAIAQ